MIRLIVSYRLRSWLKPSRFEPLRPLPQVDLVTEVWDEDEKRPRASRSRAATSSATA